MMSRRSFDVSELYDLFQSRRECYFICCDIKNLIHINEIAHKAGDLGILEAIHRMERAVGEEDVVFRIGGDEFVILTDSEDETYAWQLAQKILAHNGECFDYDGQKLPLDLYAGVVKLGEKTQRYNELFTELQTVILQAKHEADKKKE